jgi:hypothetical protein
MKPNQYIVDLFSFWTGRFNLHLHSSESKAIQLLLHELPPFLCSEVTGVSLLPLNNTPSQAAKHLILGLPYVYQIIQAIYYKLFILEELNDPMVSALRRVIAEVKQCWSLSLSVL